MAPLGLTYSAMLYSSNCALELLTVCLMHFRLVGLCNAQDLRVSYVYYAYVLNMILCVCTEHDITCMHYVCTMFIYVYSVCIYYESVYCV